MPSSSSSPIQDSAEGVLLTIHVQPNASRSNYVGLHGDALHRFHLFRWNGQEMPGDDVSRIRVGIAEQAVAYADLQQILMQRGEAWEHHVVPH